jgi:hypothetical protein
VESRDRVRNERIREELGQEGIKTDEETCCRPKRHKGEEEEEKEEEIS